MEANGSSELIRQISFFDAPYWDLYYCYCELLSNRNRVLGWSYQIRRNNAYRRKRLSRAPIQIVSEDRQVMRLVRRNGRY